MSVYCGYTAMPCMQKIVEITDKKPQKFDILILNYLLGVNNVVYVLPGSVVLCST